MEGPRSGAPRDATTSGVLNDTTSEIRLLGVELWRVRLALHEPVRTAAGEHRGRPVIYARLVAGEGEGWAESPALDGGTLVDPAHDDVWQALVERAVPRLLQEGPWWGHPGRAPGDSWTAIARWCTAILETAWWDLRCRRRGAPLWSVLGASREVATGGMVGIPADHLTTTLVDGVGRLVAIGLPRVRVKIAPGWDTGPLTAVREAYPRLVVQADANGAYRWGGGGPDDAHRLLGLDGLDLTCVEQPLPPEDLEGHAELGRLLSTPVCLDEGLWSGERVAAALATGACTVACLKPARLGGVGATLETLAACREAGVRCFVGGFFETGLGRAVNAALAGLPGASLPGDLAEPDSYLADPCGYPKVERGRLRLEEVPGSGRPPATEVLEELGAERRWTAAPGGPRTAPPAKDRAVGRA